MKKNRNESEESLSKLKKYYRYDDIEYKGIGDVGNLFNQSIDEDYYKQIRTVSVFDNKDNYIKYGSNEDKDKILSVKEYLDLIKPYLSDIINDHKTVDNWQLTVHSIDKVIFYETEGELKIQLWMTINFISSEDFDEIGVMRTKSDYIEIMTGDETNDIIKKLFESLFGKISSRGRRKNDKRK